MPTVFLSIIVLWVWILQQKNYSEVWKKCYDKKYKRTTDQSHILGIGVTSFTLTLTSTLTAGKKFGY